MPWSRHGSGLRRPVGDSEYAFIPSATKDGLGDMFLHLAFRAPKYKLDPHRVTIAWTILRLRHPLLMAAVVTVSDEYLFEFQSPQSPNAAVESAKPTLIMTTNAIRESMMLDYMNGPRTLSNDQLSRLTISQSVSDDDDLIGQYDLLMCAPHFIGDGTSLHQAADEILDLLASPRTNDELEQVIAELCKDDWIDNLPPPMEDRLPSLKNRWAKTAARVSFEQTLYKEIGGQSLSRCSSSSFNTLLLEKSYTTEKTSEILKKCKRKGVTINHAIFSLCSIAWAKVKQKNENDLRWKKLPVMVYSAINLRPYLVSHSSTTPWFIALTYFNVAMPSFPPSQDQDRLLADKVFWDRTANIKSQIRRTTQSLFLLERAREMGTRRAARVGRPYTISPSTLQIGKKAGCRQDAVLDPAPSTALLGLSLIGNLDSVYKGSTYTSESSRFVLQNVTTASRLKPGGLLLLSHTFRGQLWFQLFFDVEGFAKNETGQTEVEEFWTALQESVEEYFFS